MTSAQRPFVTTRVTVPTPFFIASFTHDRVSWAWENGVTPDAALLSYDVLGKWPDARTTPIMDLVAFEGLLVIDSGGYGESAETDNANVFEAQRAAGADLGVVLDEHIEGTATADPALKRNLANITDTVKRNHPSAMSLEAVVHANSPDQLAYFAAHLPKSGVTIVGVPCSTYSMQRDYEGALDLVLRIRAAVGPRLRMHALGGGSRTLIAVLSAAGVDMFDSTNYYKLAVRHEALPAYTKCTFGTPLGKPACQACLRELPVPSDKAAPAEFAAYNLAEIMKEIIRSRCAQEEQAVSTYLDQRLKPSLADYVKLRLSAASDASS